MLTKEIRQTVILFSLFLTLWNFSKDNETLALVFLGLCLYTVYTYFRHASVWLAFQNIKRKNLYTAYKLLKETPNPKLLAKKQVSYYYWGMGIIKISENNFDDAEEHLSSALNCGMENLNNMALVNMALTQISLFKREADKARAYLEEAKRIPHQQRLNPVISILEEKVETLESEPMLEDAFINRHMFLLECM